MLGSKIKQTKGDLSVGSDADLVIFTPEWDVKATIVLGMTNVPNLNVQVLYNIYSDSHDRFYIYMFDSFFFFLFSRSYILIGHFVENFDSNLIKIHYNNKRGN